MNKFVQLYQDFRKQGKEPIEALGWTSAYIASTGTIEDLNIVARHFTDDSFKDIEKTMKEAEDFINENNSVEKSKVG